MAEMPNESGQQAAEAGRAYLEEMSEVNRKLFGAWAAGAEATLKATLETQSAALSAGLSLLGVASSHNQAASAQLADVARQAQQAALEAFQATLRAAERAMPDVPKTTDA